MQRKRATVKWFNEIKGYGFLIDKKENEYFVHYKALRSPGRRTLLENQDVSFIPVETERGVEASDVVVVG